MNLGDKIKELRLKNNMTQDDLAEKCYVTRNAVSKWENDKGYPNIESLKLLCKCFNITIDELLNDEISNEAVKELTVEVIKNDTKLNKHYDIIVGVIIILVYFIVQIALRELALSVDPTSGLAWGLVIAPFCSVIIGIIAAILVRKPYITYLVGFISLLFSVLFDSIIQNDFTPAIIHCIYYLLYLFISISTYSIKYQRFMFIPQWFKRLVNRIIEVKIKVKLKLKTKIIINSCILGLTFIWFLIELILSIIREIKSIDHPSLFGGLNGVPLLYIMLFIIPLALEGIHLFVLCKKEKPVYLIYDDKKIDFLNIISVILPSIFIILMFLPIHMYNGIWELNVRPKNVLGVLNWWSVIPIVVQGYCIVTSLISINSENKKTFQILNIVISVVCFVVTILISTIIWNSAIDSMIWAY